MSKIYEVEVGGKSLIIETGRLAAQANGSITVAIGETVVLVTAWGSIALAVEGVKAGAADFLTKPWSNAHVIQSIDTALSLAAAGLDGEVHVLENQRDVAGAHHVERLARAGGTDRLVAVLPQQETQRRGDRGVVVHHQDRAITRNAGPPPGRCASRSTQGTNRTSPRATGS